MSSPVKLIRSGPGLDKIRHDIRRLQQSDVLVGIPADHQQRKKEGINNPSLLFIHTHGSELQRIPPRPVLEPSIEANREIITPHLGAAAQAIMENQPEKASNELARAGIVASNSAKRWFTDPRNNWPPNAPSTIEEKGSDRPLIDTGQLRRAITWAVREQGTVKKPVEATSDAEEPKQSVEEEPLNVGETVDEVAESTAESVVEEAAEVLASPLKVLI